MKKAWIITLLLALGMTMGSPSQAEEHDDEGYIQVTEKETLQFLKKNVPGLLEELKEVKREDGEREYKLMLQELQDMLSYYYELKEVSPETADALLRAEQLEQDTYPVAEKIAGSKDDQEKAVLEARLKGMLDEIFELRLKEYAWEIKELESELNEIRNEFERRKKNKDLILNNRMKEIMAEVDEALSWW